MELRADPRGVGPTTIRLEQVLEVIHITIHSVQARAISHTTIRLEPVLEVIHITIHSVLPLKGSDTKIHGANLQDLAEFAHT